MSVNFFMISSVLLTIYQLIYLKIEYSKFFIGALIIGTLFMIVSMFVKYNNKKKPYYCFVYLRLLWFDAALMFLMTLIYNLFNVGDYSFSYIVQDIISIIIFNCGIVLTVNVDSSELLIKKYLKLIGSIALVAGIISFMFADFSQISNRDINVWKPQYIWWFLLYPWSYLLLYKCIVNKKSLYWKILAYSTTFLYIILGLLFLKRIVLLELIIILIIISVANTRKKYIFNTFRNMVIIAVVITIVYVFAKYVINYDISTIFGATLNRIEGVNIKNFDRIDEFINVFKQYPYTIILTGAGLGSYQDGPGGINMHIGWLNYLFKGGILLFALECWVFGKAIKTFLNSKNNWYKYISACVIFGYTTIIISSSWAPTPQLILFSVMKFAVLSIQERKLETA